jgi:flagellar basal-body rod protein FlgC
MSLLSIFGVAATGVNFYRSSLDAVAHNIANSNTVVATDQAAFQRQVVVPREVKTPSPNMVGVGGTVGSGVSFQVEKGSSYEGRMVYDPEHPLADEKGYVRHPDVDLATEMSDLLIAQRGYQANLAVVQRATDAYQAALQLGR